MYVLPLALMVQILWDFFNAITNAVYERGLKHWLLLLDLGLQRHRLDGDEYLAVIDEFMEAVFTRWPHVIVQVQLI